MPDSDHHDLNHRNLNQHLHHDHERPPDAARLGLRSSFESSDSKLHSCELVSEYSDFSAYSGPGPRRPLLNGRRPVSSESATLVLLIVLAHYSCYLGRPMTRIC